MYLRGVSQDFLQGLGNKQLNHSGLFLDIFPLVAHRRHTICVCPHDVNMHGHLGKFESGVLEFNDGFSELLPFTSGP